MKAIKSLFFTKAVFFSLVFIVFFNFSRAELIYYPETDDQLSIFESAIESAEQNLKPIVFVMGHKRCAWCSSLANLMMFSELGRDIAKYATIQPINLQGNAQEVVNRLKSKAGMTEKIPGFPFLFVVDTKRNVTTPISLAEMEHNIPQQNLYTHHPELVKNAVYFALGIDFGPIATDIVFKSTHSACEGYLTLK